VELGEVIKIKCGKTCYRDRAHSVVFLSLTNLKLLKTIHNGNSKLTYNGMPIVRIKGFNAKAY